MMQGQKLDSSLCQIQKEWTICRQTYQFMQDLAEAFNKATYDDTMQEFFDYACETLFRWLATIKVQVFSHRLVAMIFQKDFHSLFYDLQPMFENAETAWTSWDDKLDSDVI